MHRYFQYLDMQEHYPSQDTYRQRILHCKDFIEQSEPRTNPALYRLKHIDPPKSITKPPMAPKSIPADMHRAFYTLLEKSKGAPIQIHNIKIKIDMPPEFYPAWNKEHKLKPHPKNKGTKYKLYTGNQYIPHAIIQAYPNNTVTIDIPSSNTPLVHDKDGLNYLFEIMGRIDTLFQHHTRIFQLPATTVWLITHFDLHFDQKKITCTGEKFTLTYTQFDYTFKEYIKPRLSIKRTELNAQPNTTIQTQYEHPLNPRTITPEIITPAIALYPGFGISNFALETQRLKERAILEHTKQIHAMRTESLRLQNEIKDMDIEIATVEKYQAKRRTPKPTKAARATTKAAPKPKPKNTLIRTSGVN